MPDFEHLTRTVWIERSKRVSVLEGTLLHALASVTPIQLSETGSPPSTFSAGTRVGIMISTRKTYFLSLLYFAFKHVPSV
jgi:hypothetical protein